MKLSIRSNNGGSALVSIIIVLPFLILTTALFMELAVSSLTIAGKDQNMTHAQLAADAGIDFALQQVNVNAGWTGTGEMTLRDEYDVRTTFEANMTESTPTSQTLTVTGRTYRPSSATIPTSSRTINAHLRPVVSEGYSIVTGVGGLFMSNSSKIVGGDVLVNGEINMSNSAQIGLSTNPITVEVAHQNCPNPPTSLYPRLCGGGENGQPISISNPAWIYGTVRANNQTNGARMSNPGLQTGASISAQPLPTHNRDAQKAAAVNTLSSSAASCNSNNGTRNWPANVVITGNVSIQKGCKVTINGNVWITGNLEMLNSAEIIIANTVGSTMPDIMVDGAKVHLSNSARIVANTSKTGARVLTYWSRASCSPDCTNVTGIDLYNSREDETILISNTASAPESTLYARWTQVSLNNSGGIGALIGQTVKLSNSATITFGSSASPGSTFWVLNGYRRSFN